MSRRTPIRPKPENGGNGWNEYKNLILSELQRLNHNVEALTESVNTSQRMNIQDISDVNRRVDCISTELKAKSGVWGVIGGAIPFTVYYIIEIMKMTFKAKSGQ